MYPRHTAHLYPQANEEYLPPVGQTHGPSRYYKHVFIPNQHGTQATPHSCLHCSCCLCVWVGGWAWVGRLKLCGGAGSTWQLVLGAGNVLCGSTKIGRREERLRVNIDYIWDTLVDTNRYKFKFIIWVDFVSLYILHKISQPWEWCLREEMYEVLQ